MMKSIMDLPDWKLFLKINGKYSPGESQSVTSLIRSFWETNKMDYPRLYKITGYLLSINSSSSEIERLFSIVSSKTRDPSRNRQKMATIERNLQNEFAGNFKELGEEIKKFYNKQ
ncbi:Oidioi.mRNA.OKI2018_I69.chr1.g35.t1.cds [Oikopleura dioica]|uniref:Oidioi.mRNA.OKI2018_I69.chr1.g35.t1.cds n=1 Tax=Oikopleura dioica TaxID=34765 RepID=A0ABN7SQU3_OIKDI|nr:Oidioi.mRNA.OKI2018_I69.chr1.g35.t1.cds [Oikopleura dioica]